MRKGMQPLLLLAALAVAGLPMSAAPATTGAAAE